MVFKSIRSRIIFTYMIIFLGTLLLLNSMIYIMSREMIINNKKEILQTQEKYFVESLEYLNKLDFSREEIIEEIDRIQRRSMNLSIKISDEKGNSIGNIPLNIPKSGIVTDKITLLDGEDDEEREFFYMIKSYSFEDKKYFVEYVLTTDYEAYLKILIRVLIIVEIIGVLISLIAGIKTGNTLVKPIVEITNMTKRITSENLGERLPLREKEDEITSLSEAINNTFEELEVSFENQKKFISNVSHELRTPIAVMKGYIDVYKRIGIENREIAEEAIEAIDEESENMKRMVEKLLFLARGDVDGFHVEKISIDAREILEKVKKDYAPILIKQGMNLNVEKNLKIFCDQNIILQILRSLIDNAIKYGDEKGIEIGGYSTGDNDVIYVKDFGRGISEEEKKNIFERFYRIDSARNRNDGNMGLGLSIVKKLAKIHRCQIEIESAAGKGSKFMLVFNREELNEKNTDSRG